MLTDSLVFRLRLQCYGRYRTGENTTLCVAGLRLLPRPEQARLQC